MAIDLEINGTQYTNFTSAGVNLALDTLANDFAFQAALPAGESLPFKRGDACRILVDGELAVTGYIEDITGSYSAGSHSITASGRDRTMDLIDSMIDVMGDIRAPITLKQIIERVIEHIGSDLKVVDNAVPDNFNKAEDIIAPQPGDNAFAFVEQYAQKRQVLLTSNSEGNIVITKSQPVESGGSLQNTFGAQDNNILTSSWASLSAALFNKYIQKGQLDPVALSFGDTESDEGIISQQGEAIDSNIREGRQLVSVSSKSFSQEQLQSRAEWSKKIRQTRSVPYSANVQGFKNKEDTLWAVNTTVAVLDDFADINRELLINTISFTFNESGSITGLGLVEKNAYELQLNEPKAVGTNQDAFTL